MLPTIAWRGRSVVMIDQRKLPGQEIYVRCRTYIQVAQAIEKMVIRGAPAIGIAAAYGLVLGVMCPERGDGTVPRARFREGLQAPRADPADGPEPLLGARADEGGLRADPGRRAEGPPRGAARRSPGHRTRGRRHEPGHRPSRPGPAAGRLDRADALQRRRAGHRGVRHGARHRPGRGRRGQADQGLRRRDAAFSPGRPADRLGARPGRHPGRSHHRQHGRLVHAARARSRPSSSGPTASPATATRPTRSGRTPWPCWPRRTASRSTSRRRPSTIDLSLADGAGIPIEERNPDEVREIGGTAPHRALRRGAQSGLRRHAGLLHHGDRHRARRPPPALRKDPWIGSG